jgi:hypothetical protein
MKPLNPVKRERPYVTLNMIMRIADAILMVFWTVLIFVCIGLFMERFLFLLVFGFHMVLSVSTFDFIENRSRPKEFRRGLWFYLYIIFISLVADLASLVEVIIHYKEHGYDAFAITTIVLWCETVFIDLVYVFWAVHAFFRVQVK